MVEPIDFVNELEPITRQLQSLVDKWELKTGITVNLINGKVIAAIDIEQLRDCV
jgi:glutamine cyclotransferase